MFIGYTGVVTNTAVAVPAPDAAASIGTTNIGAGGNATISRALPGKITVRVSDAGNATLPTSGPGHLTLRPACSWGSA